MFGALIHSDRMVDFPGPIHFINMSDSTSFWFIQNQRLSFLCWFILILWLDFKWMIHYPSLRILNILIRSKAVIDLAHLDSFYSLDWLTFMWFYKWKFAQCIWRIYLLLDTFSISDLILTIWFNCYLLFPYFYHAHTA